MEILIHHENIQIPFELEDTMTLSELYVKVKERTNKSIIKLVYAGKELKKTNETFLQLQYPESAVIHLVQPKNIKFKVEFKGSTETVTLPSRGDITVNDIKLETRNAFPLVEAFERTLPNLFQNGIALDDERLIFPLSETEVITAVDKSEVIVLETKRENEDSGFETIDDSSNIDFDL